MSTKCEKVQRDLDQLLANQAKQDSFKNEDLKKETDNIKNKDDQQFEKQNEIIDVQSEHISDLSFKIKILMQENSKLKQRKMYSCDECNFDSEIRDQVLDHKLNEHQENESDEEESPLYQCDLCRYNSGWPDNVAFHYGEVHGIQMNLKEAEIKLID
jgi:hypothetical protein